MSLPGEAGAAAEALAARHLARAGYRILARNFRVPEGELDLVCVHESVLCFVEVRYRAAAEHGAPEETISWEKRQRLARAARAYLAKHPTRAACRFDVVSIVGDEVTVIQDAFRSSRDP